MTPHYRQSFTYALTGHVLLIIAALLIAVVPGCLRPNPIELPDINFIPVDTTHPLSRTTPLNGPPTPTPPTPDKDMAPQAPHDPPKPDDPVPPPKQPEKQPEKQPDKEAVVAPAPDHSKTPIRPPKAVHSNATATAHADHVPVVIGPKVTRVVRTEGATSRVHQAPRISAGELAKALGGSGRGAGYAAPLGETDSVPLDEQQRCFLLIKRAFYDAWDQPGAADAGSRPAELELRFDLSGRVVGYRVSGSSGSEVFDRSVLLAAKDVPRVGGLSASFLRKYAKLTIDFKLE